MEKAFFHCIVLVLLLLMVSGCSQMDEKEPLAQESLDTTANLQSIQSPEKISWEKFMEDMKKQGVSFENIHAIETLGISKEDIMDMSAEEILSKLDEVQKVTEQNKIELAKEMLADPESVKNESQFVYSDAAGTTNLGLIEQCINSIKSNDWASFTGLMMGGTIPFFYEIAFEPDGQVIFTTYNNYEGYEKSIVADIYETEMFYQFTDNQTFYFSLPKVSLIDTSIMEEYKADTDLPNAKITIPQAKEQVILIDRSLNDYYSYVYDHKLGNPMNGYGIIIPKEFTKPAQSGAAIEWDIVCDGAATILGNPYYQVSFYQNETFMGNSYYINAENGNDIFNISMVDGSLIPISSAYTQHYHKIISE